MQKTVTRKYQTGFVRRYTALALITVFGYLCEVCIMPYIRPFGVSMNILYVVIGIVTVAYGKLRAFWVGLVFGLLMEIMLPSVTVLFLILEIYNLILWSNGNMPGIAAFLLPILLVALLCSLTCLGLRLPAKDITDIIQNACRNE